MLCRVCLNKSEFKIKIFDENSEQQISTVIKKHFWFAPERNDAISTIICLDCWKTIREFNEFYETIQAKHKLYFEQYSLAEGLTTTKTECQDSENIGKIHEFEIIEPIVTIYEDNEQAKSINKQTDELSIKHEPELSNQANARFENESSSDDIDFKKYKRRSNKSPKKAVAKKHDGPKTKKDNMWSSAKSAEIIRKHLNLNCDICSFPTQTFAELGTHFQTTHAGVKAYIQCCGRRYNKIQRVAQHAYTHEDPNSFQCDVCQKTFLSAYSMRTHKVAFHPAADQLNFQCDQCEHRFSLQRLLDQHKATHVPLEERQFSCTDCDKVFASEQLLKIHILNRHKTASNICHICAKTIHDKRLFKKHVQEHFGIIGPRVKCPYPGCEKYLKDEQNLKVHLRRHKSEEIPCEQCGKIFKSRMALRSHRLYTHTEKQFSCQLCSKTFKRKITLNEHMAAHTGEALYKCPFCERTFNSNANMYSHKKKQHPVEWEHWHKINTQSAPINNN